MPWQATYIDYMATWGAVAWQLPPPHIPAKMMLGISLKSMTKQVGAGVVANRQRSSLRWLININNSRLCESFKFTKESVF